MSEYDVRVSIDTLNLSMWIEWQTADIYKDLEASLAVAREGETAIPFEFHNREYLLHPKAPGFYRYHLQRGDVHLLLSRHRSDGKLPNTKLEIGSLSCWDDIVGLYQHICASIVSHAGKIRKELVSRIDIYADVIGLDMGSTHFNSLDNWITSATRIKVETEHRNLTGIYVGSSNLMLRVYDKVRELKNKKATNKQKFFSQVWGVDHYEEKPVTRFEYQFRRKVLAEFDSKGVSLDTFSNVFKNLQGLWTYATEEWSRFASSAVDRVNNNQSKAEVSPIWSFVQGILWNTRSTVQRVTHKVRKNIDALADQARGIVISIISTLGIDPKHDFLVLAEAEKVISTALADFMADDFSKFYKLFNKRKLEALAL